jgi:hypothetical protein
MEFPALNGKNRAKPIVFLSVPSRNLVFGALGAKSLPGAFLEKT